MSQADESQEAVDRMSEIENYLDRDASLLINVLKFIWFDVITI